MIKNSPVASTICPRAVKSLQAVRRVRDASGKGTLAQKIDILVVKFRASATIAALIPAS